MHPAVLACPVLTGLFGLLQIFYPWTASSLRGWHKKKSFLVLWFATYCVAVGVVYYLWRRHASHEALQALLELSWLYGLTVEVSTQWEISDIFEQKVVIFTATIAASCQVSGFVVSHFPEYTGRESDLAFAGSLIFHVAAAMAVNILYKHEKIRKQEKFVLFASTFILAPIGGIAIRVSIDGDWFLLGNGILECLVNFFILAGRLLNQLLKGRRGVSTALGSRESADAEETSQTNLV